jgi:hypothetical protein
VGGGSSAHSINSDSDRAVGTVLEADRERNTGCKFTVELGLGGTGTNSTPRNKIGEVLGRDGIEEFGSNGNAAVGKVTEELAGNADTLVNLERAVDLGVVDQTLPANSSTGLLAVDT